MTSLEPSLFLERLVIRSNPSTTVYDEKFHRGVNIIRGSNSSGKSTIANSIFFALGGDFQNWTSQIKVCLDVFAQTEISGATLTLHRNIVESGQQPMDIFWGTFDKAKRAALDDWKNFSYKSSLNKESFSNVLFSTLGFPEVKTPDESKITMHQVLRLMYIDQDSPSDSLFRFERWDQGLTRQTIADLLLGVYDDQLYNDRLSLKEAEQQQEQKKQEFTAIKRIFGATGQQIDRNRIEKDVQKAKSQLVKIQTEINLLRTKTLEARKNTSPYVKKLNDELGKVKTDVSQLLSDIKQHELDIVDSQEFIDTLNKKLEALDDSVATKQAFGELPLEYCPLCLTPLTGNAVDQHCVLCKQELPKDFDKTFGKRLQQEIRLQIRESQKLLKEKQRTVHHLNTKLQPLIEHLNALQREIDIEENQHKSTRDQRWDELLIEQGRLENQLDVFSRQLASIEQLEILQQELRDLASRITKLRQQIQIGEEKERLNYRSALDEIRRITLLILRRDLDYQGEFKKANDVEVDFIKDSFNLDGQVNFSASSKVLLKNAIRFAIFFASLKLPYMRYPRFIFCDNTEDKGMEPGRSGNFQKVITDLSKSYDVEHQIILTTSMIDPSLDNTSYCVGEFYTKTNKSLKMSGVVPKGV